MQQYQTVNVSDTEQRLNAVTTELDAIKVNGENLKTQQAVANEQLATIIKQQQELSNTGQTLSAQWQNICNELQLQITIDNITAFNDYINQCSEQKSYLEQHIKQIEQQEATLRELQTQVDAAISEQTINSHQVELAQQQIATLQQQVKATELELTNIDEQYKTDESELKTTFESLSLSLPELESASEWFDNKQQDSQKYTHAKEQTTALQEQLTAAGVKSDNLEKLIVESQAQLKQHSDVLNEFKQKLEVEQKTRFKLFADKDLSLIHI